MIQTKLPVIYDQRSQKEGIVKLEIRPLLPTTENGIEGQKFLVIDWDVENLENAIYSREVFWTNDEINEMESYLVANNDFSGMSRVYKEKKKLQLALFIDVTTKLRANGKTLYGLTALDWELSTNESQINPQE